MNDENQKKKMLLTALIVTSIIFLVVLIILLVLMNQEAKKTKIKFGNDIYKTKTEELNANDGVYIKKSIEYNKAELPILVKTPSGKDYYCIESLSKMANYKYNNGAYGDQIDESKDKCYIDNGGEYVTFINGSNKITKNIKNTDKYDGELKDIDKTRNVSTSSTTSSDNQKVEDLEESFTFDSPVIKFNEKLYASVEAINKGFNMVILQEEDSTINIFTLESLVASNSDSLRKSGYTLTNNFRNQRALSDGYAVVGMDSEYGVINLRDNKEIISLKYDTVEYIQSIGEFIVSQKSKFGMIKPGEEKPTIGLSYESIELLDAEKKLYIVSSNKKYGVVNSNGDEIIPTEYDQIGLDDISPYQDQGITNRYIISDICIPVKRNNLYGLYSLDGQILQSAHYTGFGCNDPSKIINNTNAMPTLTIPFSDEVTAIVFSSKRQSETTYGLVSTNGVVILNSFYSAIYYTRKNGEINYYFDKPSADEYLSLKELLKTRPQVRELIEQAKAGKEEEEIEAEQKREKEGITSTQENEEQSEEQNTEENIEENTEENTDEEENQDNREDE